MAGFWDDTDICVPLSPCLYFQLHCRKRTDGHDVDGIAFEVYKENIRKFSKQSPAVRIESRRQNIYSNPSRIYTNLTNYDIIISNYEYELEAVMADKLNFIGKFAEGFADPAEIADVEKTARKAKKILDEHTGTGNGFLGWVDLPVNYDKEEYSRIKECAKEIASNSQVLLVIGIGGSYLGAKAAIDFLSHSFSAGLHSSGIIRETPEICFVGQTISADYVADMAEYLEGRDWSINVISKSGTTTESSVAFRIFRDLLIRKYGADASKRIYATTDRSRGALKSLSDAEHYRTFVVPDDIGGRYSVLSAVGLLPIAAAGIDIDEMMAGAAEMRLEALQDDFSKNGPVKYAILRNVFYRQGKKVEVLATEGPSFRYLGQWWIQLFAESEGKEQKGIFPATIEFTTDLHSIGQYIQDGERMLMETVVNVREPRRDVTVPDGDSLDGLDYLKGMKLGEICRKAVDGAVLAHVDGGVPVMRLEMGTRNARNLGRIFYFFEYACAVSGYMLEVNPFDQPGVENYKKNMFALLGRPGYAERGEELRKRLG